MGVAGGYRVDKRMREAVKGEGRCGRLERRGVTYIEAGNEELFGSF